MKKFLSAYNSFNIVVWLRRGGIPTYVIILQTTNIILNSWHSQPTHALPFLCKSVNEVQFRFGKNPVSSKSQSANHSAMQTLHKISYIWWLYPEIKTMICYIWFLIWILRPVKIISLNLSGVNHKMGQKGRSPRKNTSPPASRTWFVSCDPN